MIIRFAWVAVVALLWACTVQAAGLATAGGLVDFIDYTPHGSQPGLTHSLQGASNCTSCHSNGPEETYYPGLSWSGSMKANSMRDPLFWAALDVANRDGAAAGAPGLGDFCLRCHTPQGWYNGRVRKRQALQPINGQVDPADLIDGADGCQLQGKHDFADVSGNDYAGIGCHFCHRKQAEGPEGQPAMIANADVWLDDGDCGGAGQPCRAGPYSYPVTLPGGGEFSGPPHAWEQSHFIGSAEACGSCHDVTSPPAGAAPFKTLIVADGTAAGHDTGLAFPIERTYSEWRSSDFSSVLFRDDLESRDVQQRAERISRGGDCRDCHMPQAKPLEPEGEVLACFFGPPRNAAMPVHEFVGGNTWVPNIIKGEFPLLGRADAFDWTVARATDMLSQRSARVQSESRLVDGGSAVELDVKVTNLSGHKLPTGYGEGRRIWLSVEVRDAEGELLWENGAWDPASGELAKDEQTRVYEIKQGIWNAASGTCDTRDAKGREMFHFVLNNCVAKDNRIPPAGFRGGSDLELRSVGHSYPETAPGSGVQVNYDLARYIIPLNEGVSFPLSVTAALRYQTASKEYIEFLRDQAVEHSIPAENTLCADGPGRPFDVGPQHRSRGQYVFELWSNPSYGRSPPVTMGTSTSLIGPD